MYNSLSLTSGGKWNDEDDDLDLSSNRKYKKPVIDDRKINSWFDEEKKNDNSNSKQMNFGLTNRKTGKYGSHSLSRQIATPPAQFKMHSAFSSTNEQVSRVT